ncbi:DUF2795 domain-containing protein [Saccharothrix coeruleofusca]|uniref:DUF2795 domain-containing protein n=1 Tax=Saccharothrix coeruleofusca TaxID=33919 RepID=A0A918EG35_9PSEU|nr:DUF2795 domain-containing protein [Saccharothrix coeruleofusca]MBP2337470.1 hypothetical protein [Saccharothrix coeruleofusca]GGP65568.1 hypothetical protein GCM10010185_42980 [Saccharothrix coeruleofusca]
MSAYTTRERLRASLNEVDFPAGKDELVRAAQERGDEDTARALRAIPPVDYANLAEVEASVRFDDDTTRADPSGR